MEKGTNRYEIWLIKDDFALDSTTWSFDATNFSPAFSVDFFLMEPRESGTYTFTVKALGNGQDLTDGPVATSPERIYTCLLYTSDVYKRQLFSTIVACFKTAPSF